MSEVKYLPGVRFILFKEHSLGIPQLSLDTFTEVCIALQKVIPQCENVMSCLSDVLPESRYFSSVSFMLKARIINFVLDMTTKKQHALNIT